jgi:Xaa-Pro aminopeptidase
MSRPVTDYEKRRERLREQLATRRLRFLLLTHPPNVFYLTGFRGSAGALLVGSRGEARLFVDPRYTLQAREQAGAVRVAEVRGRLLQATAKWLGRRRSGPVGFESVHMAVAEFTEFESHLKGSVRLKPASGLVESLRAVKDEGEIEAIRRAGRVTAEVFLEVRKHVRPGVREADLAAEIEYRMRKKGADGAAFETIVASGDRAAHPHARASSKLLKKFDFVIVDLGAILDAYAADMTRTLYLGRPTPRVRGLYAAVRAAQERGLAEACAGAVTGDVDAAVRRSLRRARLARYFTHSTGHGVGLEIHEQPRLARGDPARLEQGSVVTIEPGIYLKGFGGIRIEDTVLVGAAGAEILTPSPKDDWWVA